MMNYFCQFQRSLPNRSGGLRRCILGTEVFFSIYLRFLFWFSISYLFIFVFLPFQNFPMPCPQPSLPSFRRKHKFSTKFFVSTLLFLFLITIIIVLQWNKVHHEHYWRLNCSHCHKKKLWKTVHHHNNHHHKYHNDKNHHLKTITKSKWQLVFNLIIVISKTIMTLIASHFSPWDLMAATVMSWKSLSCQSSNRHKNHHWHHLDAHHQSPLWWGSPQTIIDLFQAIRWSWSCCEVCLERQGCKVVKYNNFLIIKIIKITVNMIISWWSISSKS